MIRELLDRYATIIVPILGALFLATCIRVGKWIERRRNPGLYRYRDPPGIVGALICTALMVGVPVLVVIWGFATGRLPAR